MAKTRRGGAKAAKDVLALPAEMTIYHAAEIRTALLEAVAGGTVKLDLAHVGEFDSTGLQLLLAARRTARAAGRHLELLNMPPLVHEVCATYGLDEALEPSLEGAA